MEIHTLIIPSRLSIKPSQSQQISLRAKLIINISINRLIWQFFGQKQRKKILTKSIIVIFTAPRYLMLEIEINIL